MSDAHVIRVGLLGAASIAWRAWAGVHANGMAVTRVGCRDAERGRVFVKRVCAALQLGEDAVPVVCTYEELVSASDVDVVYVAIPVTARDHWVRECVEYKKHVVGEKPPAVDAEMLRGWIEALDAQRLLYMDGTMLSHGKRISEVCAAVKELGGPIKHIFANFTIPGDEAFFNNDIRVDPTLEPHGALGDLGWYCIRYVLHLMDFQMPTEVTGRILKENEKGAVIAFFGDMTFEVDGVVALASFYVSFDAALEQTLHVATTKGTLQLDDFCQPITTRETTQFYEVHNSSHDVICDSHNLSSAVLHTVAGDTPNSQRTELWGSVFRMLTEDGEGEARRLVADEAASQQWATISWKTQAILDKLLESARISQRPCPAK